MNRSFNVKVIGSANPRPAAHDAVGIGVRPSPGAARRDTSNGTRTWLNRPALPKLQASVTLMQRVDDEGEVLLLCRRPCPNLGVLVYWPSGYSASFRHGILIHKWNPLATAHSKTHFPQSVGSATPAVNFPRTNDSRRVFRAWNFVSAQHRRAIPRRLIRLQKKIHLKKTLARLLYRSDPSAPAHRREQMPSSRSLCEGVDVGIHPWPAGGGRGHRPSVRCLALLPKRPARSCRFVTTPFSARAAPARRRPGRSEAFKSADRWRHLPGQSEKSQINR